MDRSALNARVLGAGAPSNTVKGSMHVTLRLTAALTVNLDKRGAGVITLAARTVLHPKVLRPVALAATLGASGSLSGRVLRQVRTPLQTTLRLSARIAAFKQVKAAVDGRLVLVGDLTPIILHRVRVGGSAHLRMLCDVKPRVLAAQHVELATTLTARCHLQPRYITAQHTPIHTTGRLIGRLQPRYVHLVRPSLTTTLRLNATLAGYDLQVTPATVERTAALVDLSAGSRTFTPVLIGVM